MGDTTTLTKAIQAVTNLTGRRFCSHHQGEAASNEGSVVERNKSKRWVCFKCQEKTRLRAEAIKIARRRSQNV